MRSAKHTPGNSRIDHGRRKDDSDGGRATADAKRGTEASGTLAISMEVADGPGVLGISRVFRRFWVRRGGAGRVWAGDGLFWERDCGPGRVGRGCPEGRGCVFGCEGGRRGAKSGQKAVKVAEPSAGFDEIVIRSYQADGFATGSRASG